jgi:hypothetical protein
MSKSVGSRHRDALVRVAQVPASAADSKTRSVADARNHASGTWQRVALKLLDETSLAVSK